MQINTSCVRLPSGCVSFLILCYSLRGVKAASLPGSRDLKDQLPLLRTSAFTVGDFQSTHHHSFIDSSGSASIPSSLIQKLRTAILIALRTVEVFNGLFCSRRVRTRQPAESRHEELFSKHNIMHIPLKYC